jgi:tetratricopeptide (TPR) repeat protein
MAAEQNPPRLYSGVMVSSTFKDLEKHREALIDAIHKEEFASVVMEYDSAKAVLDVIDSSLQMVRNAAAYIAVIGLRYGQTPECPRRNPDKLSITELEFNEAQRLGRPILLFLMDKDHELRFEDFEHDPANQAKLDAFRERAKKSGPDSKVNRVYGTFKSLKDFKEQVPYAVAKLRRLLDAAPSPNEPPAVGSAPTDPSGDPIPVPPALYAEPSYAASHKFVGRDAELTALSDWASAADPFPILLFDAIGGSGKSMLTWEWTRSHATKVRADWAGRFWYSFYERGAIMADFCRHALAYITRVPVESLNKVKTPELGKRLLHRLQERPWLLVLDGLERVLVTYNRIDAAELSDEEASNPTDPIASRDPCAAIRPEDDDLLRALATAAPSKLLISSRLTPRVLLNSAGQEIPGVRRVPLAGLRPPDAEALLRSCNVRGSSPKIQAYLQTNCDCHPLTTGVLAGLIQNYLPDRGNFDRWADDPEYGGQLNLAEVDLVRRRNHILNAAIAGLPEKSRQLLSTLALLSEGIDYPTLKALNPHMPPEPEEVEVPYELDERPWMSENEIKEQRQDYEAALERRHKYEQALEKWRRSSEFMAAGRRLAETIWDLQSRGLVQYDELSKRYDLHPVVRGVAAGGLREEEKAVYGQRVVDHFTAKPHNPYDNAKTLEDVRDGILVVRTLLKMGRYEEAAEGFEDLGNALFFNLQSSAETLPILRQFFPNGWSTLPSTLTELTGSSLANDAGIALALVGEFADAITACNASLVDGLRLRYWGVRLRNIGHSLYSQGRLALSDRCTLLQMSIASLDGKEEDQFSALLFRFRQLSRTGKWAEAQAIWDQLDPMGRHWSRHLYRQGDAERSYAELSHWQGKLSPEQVLIAEQLAKSDNNRPALRDLHRIRGEWHLEQSEWALAAESLQEAVSLARAVEQTDVHAETQLALAQFHLGQLPSPQEAAAQLARRARPAYRNLSELYLAIGDLEAAKKYALEAWRWAWADGEPYVFRYELNRARTLLENLGVEIPQLPPHDPSKDQPFPWEDRLAAKIDQLRAVKEAEERAKEKEAQDPEPTADPE